MRFMHRFVRQHGLAHDVADGKDVQHVGAQLDVDIDEITIGQDQARISTL